ncbi:hypothetical protein [Cupriavidus oxalaticus]|uniref:Uncharacterized protein n=1 Tax=Cupriavidus oxalaticus TaxID=96344 RepID=A0A4P7LH28_9BURK|nr:hypothetical protein [Cupriavidus oxalaticus]QBY52533.1 hypothetical protein E0W60_15190 [Cupriavidus oxalaticus]
MFANIVNAPKLRRCVESGRATDDYYACCPACDATLGDDRRRLLIRRYSNDSASLHCLRRCPEWVILARLDLTAQDLRGKDGKMPDLEPGWFRHARRYAGSLPRPLGEQ